MSGALDGFDSFRFGSAGDERIVYRRGAGPAVLVMHEVPGITPPVAAFARRVAEAGFTVFLPHLFGTPGRPFSLPYAAGQIARACVAREFSVLMLGRSSPVIDWLRGLARYAHRACGGPGVGAVGMCLTGNFALAMMIDAPVEAPVLSQPSLPFGVGAARKRALHLSADEERGVRARAAAGCPVLALRFTHDPMCPSARFEALREALGGAFEGIEIDSGPGNPHGIPRSAHSVLTEDLVDEEGHPTRAALDRVLAFLDLRLRPGAVQDEPVGAPGASG